MKFFLNLFSKNLVARYDHGDVRPTILHHNVPQPPQALPAILVSHGEHDQDGIRRPEADSHHGREVESEKAAGVLDLERDQAVAHLKASLIHLLHCGLGLVQELFTE